MPKTHVRMLPPEEQKKWLKQRGWANDGGPMFEDPNSRTKYCFPLALKRAIDETKLEQDFYLHP